MEIVENVYQTVKTLSKNAEASEKRDTISSFLVVVQSIRVIKDQLLNFKGKEISKELSKMIQDFEDLCKYIFRVALSIKRNLEIHQGQFRILKGVMIKESPLSEQDIKDVNYVIKVLERNINSKEKIEEKIEEKIMTAGKKLSALQSKIKEQQEQFDSRLKYLEKHSSKFIAGAGVLGAGTGAYAFGGAVSSFFAGYGSSIEKILPNAARFVVPVLCNRFFGVCLAACGVGILGLVAAYAITEYTKYSHENCKEELNNIDLNAEKFLVKIGNLETFLNHFGQIKADITEYTINQVKDSLENETQRKQNHHIYDKFLEESQELIELITETCN
jgi:hypothetical protein